MKKTFSLMALILAAQFLCGTIRNNTPTTPSVLGSTYYHSADNKKGAALFSALSTISEGVTYSYTKLTYDELYTAYKTSDVYPAGHPNAGKIWDMYSTTLFTAGSKECGTYNVEGDCYNREHSMPKSWFGGSSDYKSTNQGCDLGHLVPTDGYVNGRRSNYAFGEVGNASYTSNGGLSKLGATVTSLSVTESTISGTSVSVSNKTVFEPADEYKGDFARIYMYMRARYATLNLAQADGGTVHFTTTTSAASDSKYGWTDYSVILLMKWHRLDPVSQKEIDRNNAMERMQGNRNPFVDYPILAEYLWGKDAGETFLLANAVGSFDDAFVPGVSDGSKDSGIEPLDPDYYAPVTGLSDSLLKSKLAELTWAHYTKRYSYGSGKNNTWDAFWYTDRNENDNSVVDMYSNNKRYFNPSDMTASVADCDIEHMFPNSWFGAKAGNAHAYCDLHHLVPADYSANRSKSNRGPGVPTDTTFNNGVWVNGKDAGRDNLEVFCPPDEYKGDFARAFFYIATAYGDTAVWQAEAVPNHMSNSDWHEFLPLTRDLLLEWHRQDPVSEKERVRMNIVYGLQGNRNPFIDYPCLAEYIWGVHQGEPFNLDCSESPVPPTKYTITWNVDGETSSAEVTKGLRPSAPSVEDCSASRVFVGWTTSNSVSEKPEVLYSPATIPAATKPVTYYAVYADKETEEDGGDFTLYTGELTEGDYVIYYSGKAMKAAASDNRLSYETISPANNKITTEEASLIWHIAYTDGYWRIYNAQENKYAASTSTKNQARLLADGSDDCSQWTVSGTTAYEFVNKKNAAASVNANLRNNSTYGFACYSTSTGGALSLYKQSGKVSYSNYSLSCSAAEKYTVEFWNGEGLHKRVTNYAGEVITGLTDPESCERYAFAGWSTAQYPGDNTIEPATVTPTVIPEGGETYYAVYSRAAVIPGIPGVPAGTTLWAEDFSGYSKNDVPTGETGSEHTGTTVYNNGKVTYACTNGGTDTKIYADVLAGGVSPEILIAKSNGAFQISHIPTGKAPVMTLTFKVNKTTVAYCTVSSPTKGITVGTQTIAEGVSTCDITNEAEVAYFDLVISNTNAGTNGREDDFLLVVKTSGGTPDVPVTYYTTEPDCSPVVIPEYTLRFMNGEDLHDEITGQEGEGILVYDPTPACEQYTFSGWSEAVCSTHSTEKPELVVPTVIPGEDKTYYAVFSKTVEAGIGLTNRYRRITTASELTSANYLVVADTSKLLAMSTDWKNNYYLNSVEVTENEGVITTENGKIVWAIRLAGNGLTFYNSASGYLYIEQSVNNDKTYYNIKLGENTETNGFTFTVENGVWVFSSVSYPDRQLEYYRKNGYWAYYTGQDAPVYLYKQQEGTVYATYYTTSPDCSGELPTGCEPISEKVPARKVLKDGRLWIVVGDRVYDGIGKRLR